VREEKKQKEVEQPLFENHQAAPEICKLLINIILHLISCIGVLMNSDWAHI